MKTLELHLLVLCSVLLSLSASAWAVTNLPFGQVSTGTITSPAQTVKYSFSANTGDVIDFAVDTTSGTLNPLIQVFTSNGTTPFASAENTFIGCEGGPVELNSVTLPASPGGTYIVWISDCGTTNTGDYSIYAQRTNNPSGAVNLPLDQSVTGTIGSVVQSNTYTLSGTENEVLDFSTLATSGILIPRFRLYKPDGSLLSSAENVFTGCAGGELEMNTVTLPETGTYTLLFADCNDVNSGGYTMFVQSTNDPAGTITDILWGEVQPGTIVADAGLVQSSTYTFSGTANDVLDLTIVPANGSSLDPRVRIYNPDGSLFTSAENTFTGCAGGTLSMKNITIPTTGTYVALFDDCNHTNGGNYTLSSQCFGVCLLPAPVLTSLSPSSLPIGSGGFTLTVNGANFVEANANSVVEWNGNALTTTWVSTTQMTATVPGSYIATPNAASVTISTPAPGGGTSAAKTFLAIGSQTISFPTIATQVALTTVTLAATATSGLTVSYTSLTPLVCTAGANSASLIASGTCTIQASQPGDNIYNAATPVNQSFTVTAAPQTITFPIIATQYALTQLALPATASSTLAVSYASTTQEICTVSGATASLLLPGTCTIQATQAGNAAYAAAPMVQQSFTVSKAQQTIAFTPVTGTQYALTSLPISATATSGLAVSFASATSSVCTVSGSTVSLLTPGACVIHATQGGSTLYFPAAMVSLDIAVAKAQQSISFPAITATQYALGQVTLAATASSGLDVTFASASPAVCTISGTTASLLQQGTCIVQATQAGNSFFAAAPLVQQNIPVHLAAQTITFPAPTAEQFALTQLQLTATATSGLPITYSSITPAVCTVSGSTASLLEQGICYLHATQAGNNVYSVAQLVVQSVIVHLAPQTITFPAITGTQFVLSQLTLSATASSGLTVSFASATPAVCTVSGTTASLLTTGDCVIHATQSGNATIYAVAQLVSQSFIVHANPQTITFPAITTTLTAASTLPLTATASSGLTVSFASTTPAVCTVSGTTANLLTSGICIVQATQAGNANYAAATLVQQNLVVHLAAQTITFPSVAAQVAGANVTLGATASSGLAVTYTSVTTPVCTVSGSTATMVSAGACVIHATQTGNATYGPAPLVSKQIIVTAAAVQ